MTAPLESFTTPVMCAVWASDASARTSHVRQTAAPTSHLHMWCLLMAGSRDRRESITVEDRGERGVLSRFEEREGGIGARASPRFRSRVQNKRASRNCDAPLLHRSGSPSIHGALP